MLNSKKTAALKDIIESIKEMAVTNKNVEFFDHGDTRKEFGEIVNLTEQAETILYG